MNKFSKLFELLGRDKKTLVTVAIGLVGILLVLLSLGGGSNMALPIWGIFMKKVLENGTLGISETDRFIAPAGVSLNLNCDGGDADAQASEEEDDNYFFE